MFGTEKQVKWAVEIKATTIKSLQDELARAEKTLKRVSKKYKDQPKSYASEKRNVERIKLWIAYIKTIKSAPWFIDHRTIHFIDTIDDFERTFPADKHGLEFQRSYTKTDRNPEYLALEQYYIRNEDYAREWGELAN